MAYPYYPQNYNFPQYQTQQPIQQQIQNGGFVRVMSEDEARNYPVAPGYSVTFIDDTATYCYTKTAGFSQFDKPKFEKYRLIKENSPENGVSPEGDKDTPEYALKADLDKLRAEFKKFKTKAEKEDD